MSATYLLGYKDYWFPCRTAFHEFPIYQRDAMKYIPNYEQPNETYRFFQPDDDDDVAGTCIYLLYKYINVLTFVIVDANVDDDMVIDDDIETKSPSSPSPFGNTKQTMRAVSSIQMYKFRSPVLRLWSAFELTMGFICEKSTCLDAYALQNDKHNEEHLEHIRHSPRRTRNNPGPGYRYTS